MSANGWGTIILLLVMIFAEVRFRHRAEVSRKADAVMRSKIKQGVI